MHMRPYGQGILKNSKIYFCSLGSDEHRSFLFWPLCVGHYYCDGDYIVKRQNYNSFLVLYVIRGSLYVENLQHGGRSIVEPGGFAILDCYKPHCYGSTTGCEILWAHFDGPEARHYYDFMKPRGRTALLPADPETSYRYLMRLYDVYDKNKPASDALISKYIIGILTEFMIGVSDSSQSIASKLEHVRAYIDDNLTESLALEELADLAGLSVFYFSRQFKKQFGCTPHDYVVRSRLNMARFYLKTSPMSVKEVAFRCGFEDECNFCTCFKKRSGCTPAQFRASAEPIQIEDL